jgi:hypothetical protein
MYIQGFSSDTNYIRYERRNANFRYVAHRGEVMEITIKCNDLSCQTLKYSNKPHTKAGNISAHHRVCHCGVSFVRGTNVAASTWKPLNRGRTDSNSFEGNADYVFPMRCKRSLLNYCSFFSSNYMSCRMKTFLKRLTKEGFSWFSSIDKWKCVDDSCLTYSPIVKKRGSTILPSKHLPVYMASHPLERDLQNLSSWKNVVNITRIGIMDRCFIQSLWICLLFAAHVCKYVISPFILFKQIYRVILSANFISLSTL